MGSLNIPQSDRSQVVTTWHQIILNSVGRHARATLRRDRIILLLRDMAIYKLIYKL